MTRRITRYGQYLIESLTISFLLLTILSVFANVILRYVFNNSYIALQELEWHFFSALFLLTMSYALQKDAHVRVDLIYQHLEPKKQAFINIIGAIFFILPISFIITYYSTYFSYEAYLLGEESGDPGGLPYRFVIKGIIPIAFTLLIINTFTFISRNWQLIKYHTKSIHKEVL